MLTYLNPADPMVRYGTLLKLHMTELEGVREKNLLVSKDFNHLELLCRIHDEGVYKSEEVLERAIAILIEEKFVFDVEVSCLELGDRGRVCEAQQNARKAELNHQVKVLDAAAEVLRRNTYVTYVSGGTLCVLDTSFGPTLGVVKLMLRGVSGLEKIIRLDVVGPPTTAFPIAFDTQLEHHYQRTLQQHYPDEYLTLTVKVSRADLAQAEDALLSLEVRCG